MAMCPFRISEGAGGLVPPQQSPHRMAQPRATQAEATRSIAIM